MNRSGAAIAVGILTAGLGAYAWAQSNSKPPATPSAAPALQTEAVAGAAKTGTASATNAPLNPNGQPAGPPPVPTGPPPTPPNAVLVMMGLDKITGRPTRIVAHLNQPVQFATFTITARYCYSTPPSETPETSAFLQIDDHRPDQQPRRVFSGWMYASTPALNAVEHPLYDVWVISCSANEPGQTPPTVASAAPVKVKSPDATDSEGIAPLPEGAGQ